MAYNKPLYVSEKTGNIVLHHEHGQHVVNSSGGHISYQMNLEMAKEIADIAWPANLAKEEMLKAKGSKSS